MRYLDVTVDSQSALFREWLTRAAELCAPGIAPSADGSSSLSLAANLPGKIARACDDDLTAIPSDEKVE